MTDHALNLQLMTDAIPQQVWTAFPDGRLSYVNKKVAAYFGRDAEYVIGSGWQEFVHPDELGICLDSWTQSLETGTEYQIEFRLRKNDGTYRWHLGRAIPVFQASRITHWYGTNTGIEERKEFELRQEAFISVASHELRTPLTTAKGYLQLALSLTDLSAAVKGLLLKTADGIKKLEALTGDLLDTSRISTGKFELKTDHFMFDEMVKDTIEAIQLGTRHQIIIESLPVVGFKGDRLRIEQVLTNLLTNAIKYSPGKMEIRVRVTAEKGNIIVSVTDQGVGIQPDELSRLFERFYRVSNPGKHFDGLGLGLYISAAIINQHGGNFWVESSPGQGSTFNFLLPAAGKQEIKVIDTDGRTYYYGNFIEVKADLANEWLDVNWIGFQNVETVKAGGAIILDLFQKNKLTKVLNDNSNVLGNWGEASDWARTTWFPLMEKAGLKHFAWIFSKSTFSQLAAANSVDESPGLHATMMFADKQDAISWLNAV